MDRRSFLKTSAIGGSAAAASATLAAPAYAQGNRTLTMVTTWGRGLAGVHDSAQRVADSITAMTDGALTVDLKAAGELVGAFEVFDAVTAGQADMYHGADYYFTGQHPGYAYFTAVPFGMTPQELTNWYYHGDGHALHDELGQIFGLKSFIGGNTGPQAGGWYNKEINSPEDFKGLSMRISGLGAKVLNKLGASTQLVPGSEIYLALERGRVDATEFSVPQVDQAMGFNEVAKYYYFPGWHQSASWFSLLINQQVWDSYSDQRKAQFQTACRATLQWAMAEAPPAQVRAIHELEAKGVEVKRFPEPVMTALQKAWGEVLEEEKQTNPDFAKAYDSLMKHAALIDEWYELQAMPQPMAMKQAGDAEEGSAQ